MRRLAPFTLVALALALPAGALAVADAPGDGTLVVKNGSAPRGVPVVTLVIEGTAIGHVSTASDQVDRVVIDDVNNTGDLGASNTTGAIIPVARKTLSDTETRFVGSDFRFRAAGGLYKVWIYGSGVDVFAVGSGKVTIQGVPDSNADGRYSFNGGDFRSLPAAPTDWLTIGSPAGANG
jgi:hypothetical protein